MIEVSIWVLIIVVLFDIGVLGGVTYFFVNYLMRKFRHEQNTRADNIIQVATEKSRGIELEAKDRALKFMQEAEAEAIRRRQEITKEEERLQKRRADLDHRMERLEQREVTINKRQSALDRRANEIEKMASQEMAELQRIAQMTIDEARTVVLAEAEKEGRQDMARIIRQIEAEARQEGEKRAREIIADAIQRVASEHVSEVTTSIVTLPNEEMKGRIVGRNGRNIRAFEQAAGVDVIVDDTPEAVTVSCFDPVRREVARRALSRLILDGRIHPAHIEKILNEEQRQVDKDIEQAGEQAAYDANVAALHPEILRVLGRLKYRTSYGQNQLAHAVEVSKLAAVIASELGADMEICKAGALLHDLGKASRAFQMRLRGELTTADGRPERNQYRHEWVSLRLFEAFVGQDDDATWLARLANPTAEDDATWLDWQRGRLQRDGMTTSSQLPCQPPFARLAHAPLAQAVGWLVLTHHRLPSVPASKPITAASFETSTACASWFWPYEVRYFRRPSTRKISGCSAATLAS